MSFDIAGGLRNLLPGPLDALRGPYDSLAAANGAIPSIVVNGKNFREGKFVDIRIEGALKTYWWIEGFNDTDLVEYIDLTGVVSKDELIESSRIGGIDFNNGEVRFNDSAVFGTGSWTIELSLTITNNTTLQQIIHSGTGSPAMFILDNKIYISKSDIANVGYIGIQDEQINKPIWLTVVYNGSDAPVVKVNNFPQNFFEPSAQVFTASYKPFILGRNDNGSAPFKGFIHSLRVSNRALADNEISIRYNMGVPQNYIAAKDSSLQLELIAETLNVSTWEDGSLNNFTGIISGDVVVYSIRAGQLNGIDKTLNTGSRSDISTQTVGAAIYSEPELFTTPYKKLKSIFIKAPVSGDIKVSFFTLADATATVIYEKTLSATGGKINEFNLSRIGFDYPDKYEKIFIGLSNVSSDPAFQPIQASTVDGSSVFYSIDITTKVVSEVSAGIKMAFWAEFIVSSSYYTLNNVSNDYDLSEALANNNEVMLRDGVHRFKRSIEMPDKRKLYGTKKAIVISEAEKTIIINTADGVELHGFTLDGRANPYDIDSSSVIANYTEFENKKGIGLRQGVFITRSRASVISGLYIYGYDHSGIYLDDTYPLGLGPFINSGISFHSLFLEANYHGLYADEGAEYLNFTNLTCVKNLCGVRVLAGNTLISNSHFASNRINAAVMGGVGNDSHGTFSSCTFNHGKLLGLLVKSIKNGHVFNGCQFFDGLIQIEDSKGAFFAGNLIATKIIVNVNSGQLVKITNNMFNGDAYESGTIIKTGMGKLQLNNNEFIDGSDSTSINTSQASSYVSYFGATYAIPTTLAELQNLNISQSTPFQFETGTTFTNFIIGIQTASNIGSVTDLDVVVGGDITSLFTLRSTVSGYKIFAYTTAVPFTESHTLNITLL